MKKVFATLYKKTSAGKIQSWNIWAEDNVIHTEWGQVSGKRQQTQDEIKEGKNLGKTNATTAEQQAQAEAMSQHEKKLKNGYVKSAKDAEAGKVDKIIKGGIVPMTAKKFSEQAHKIIYPAFAQQKFDGHRCLAILKRGKCTLWSRKRNKINSVPHINREIERVFGEADIILDGELYHHDYRHNFEELTHFIRQSESIPGHEVVQFHTYDIAGTKETFKDRWERLSWYKREGKYKDSRDSFDPKIVVVCKTVKVDNEEELMEFFEECIEEEYEGAMVRNAAGLYVSKRSSDLQKIKEFDDYEFECVDVIEGRGKLTGHGIFIMKTNEGVTFESKMMGKLENLKKYWDNPSLAIGRMFTVKYQGFTKAGKPRFNRTLRPREDI